MAERKIYQVRYVVSGSVVERYTYEKNQYRGFEQQHNIKGKNRAGIEQDKNRAVTLSRARKTVMRSINSNPDMDKFLTLTFRDNVTDLDYANKEFKAWIKRVNYHVFNTKKCLLKYVAVIEFQKRGAIHYHVISNLPYVDIHSFEELWGHGFVKLNKIKGDMNRFGSNECDNVGAYVCKYMTKDNDDPRLKERKSYLMSRNLKKPEEFLIGVNEKEDVIANALHLDDPMLAIFCHEPACSAMFDNEYVGRIIYEQYNTKRMKSE